MRALILLLTAGLLVAQDSRNTYTPDTDTHAKLPEFHNLHDWEARKAHLRAQILTATGLYPMPAHGTPKAEVFGKLERQGYTIEKVLIETLPGYYLGGNLYRPLNKAGKLPGIVNPHGHWTYGRLESQPLFSGQDLGINLARQGYVVFAYDMVGYNDTLQTPHKFGTPTEQLWSFGPLQLQLWNSIRATDFLISLPDVDSTKLGVTGASGGGTQAFLLTAVDDRISFAAPVNMVSAMMQGGDFCENAPGLRFDTNNVEIAAMFAPKPMLLVSATGDWTKNVPKEEYPAIKRIYELYDKTANVEVVQIAAPHNYNQASREAVYSFFAHRILGHDSSEKVTEKHANIEMLQDMLALSNRHLPQGAVDYSQLFEEWKKLVPAPANATEAKERLRLALGVEWPEHVSSTAEGNGIVLKRAHVGDRIPAELIEGKGPAVVIAHPKGIAGAKADPAFAELRKQGRKILLIDAFQTGAAVADRKQTHEHFLTFNRSNDASRVQDILTALAFLKQSDGQTPELVGIGDAGIWATFAKAAAPVPIALKTSGMNFDGTDESYLRQFNVPNIQRAGGWEAAK